MAITATIAVTISIIGFAANTALNAANAAFAALIAGPIFPTTVIMLDIAVHIFPNIIKAGPIAAITAATFITVCFCCSFRFLNHSVKSFIFPTTLSIIGCKLSNIVVPKSTATFFTWFIAIFTLLLVVSSFANASSVAPVASCIWLNVSLKVPASSPNNTSAAFPASALLHISEKLLPSSAAAVLIISNTSERLIPSSDNCENDFPVFSLKTPSTVVPPFPNSFNILFRYVVLSAVAIPFAVNIAYDAHNWSICTLLAFAVGITLPIALANSLTVVLPKFCVIMSISETSVTLSASIP